LVTLYFDNNIWLRPFQKNSGRSEKEAEAVNTIVENCCENYEVITSDFQENYFLGTKNSLTLSTNNKDAFAKGLAVCLSITNQTRKRDPYCYNEIKEFEKKVNIKDSEDRVHIVLSWRKEVDYFITADKELYETKKKEIEEELEKMYHPTANNKTNKMQILNPITFVDQFINS